MPNIGENDSVNRNKHISNRELFQRSKTPDLKEFSLILQPGINNTRQIPTISTGVDYHPSKNSLIQNSHQQDC